jgi:ketosteroid isomerase-like protein
MNRNPYRAAFAAMTLGLVVACSPAAEVKADAKAEQEKALQAAMQADRDFAAMSAKDGLKAAFLAYMDPADGEFIGPGSVVKSAAKVADGFSQSPPGFAIEWAPDGGHGSASGDLAVTTGRYTIKAGADTLEQGRYVTVWRKDAVGALKAVMDLGVADPAAAPATTPDPEGRPG